MNIILQKKVKSISLVLGSILFILSFLLHSNKDVLLGTGMIAFSFYWTLRYSLDNNSTFTFFMLAFGVLTLLIAISFIMDIGHLKGASILLAGLVSLIVIIKNNYHRFKFKNAVFRFMKRINSVLISLVFFITIILLSLGYVETGKIVGIILIVAIVIVVLVRLVYPLIIRLMR